MWKSSRGGWCPWRFNARYQIYQSACFGLISKLSLDEVSWDGPFSEKQLYQWRSRTKMTILLLFHGGLIAISVLNNPNGFKLPSQVFLPVSLGFHSWFLNKCFIHYNGYLSCFFFMQILLPSSLWITSNSSLLCQAKIKTIPPLLLMTRLAANYILQCTKALLLARRYISYLSNAIFMASLAGITYF